MGLSNVLPENFNNTDAGPCYREESFWIKAKRVLKYRFLVSIMLLIIIFLVIKLIVNTHNQCNENWYVYRIELPTNQFDCCLVSSQLFIHQSKMSQSRNRMYHLNIHPVFN